MSEWQEVPVEPTDEMLDVVHPHWMTDEKQKAAWRETHREWWKAMLSKAPKKPADIVLENCRYTEPLDSTAGA